MLRELAPNLYTAEQPLKYLGFEIGTRMTVIRLADGSLFIHSPIRLTPEVRSDLEGIGPVKFLVAPNRFHHLFIADYVSALPASEAYCAPGLEAKRRDVRFAGTLRDAAPTGWAGQIDQAWFRAFPPLNEIIFLHRASRSLIFTDLLFNVARSDSLATRIALTLDGGLRGPAVPRTFRLLIRTHRAEARATLDRLLAWDFDRVIVTHGDVIETDGKNVVRKAWRFL